MQNKISIIIPVFNEEKSIVNVIKNIRIRLPKIEINKSGLKALILFTELYLLMGSSRIIGGILFLSNTLNTFLLEFNFEKTYLRA